MKTKHDGYLYLMPDGELLFQTMAHAERNGFHAELRNVWRVHNDDEYLMAVDAADTILRRLAK